MYIVRLRDNIHSEVSLLGDKIHYTVYSSTFGEVYAITTYYMDGFALMFPSTTLNSPLSIIYLDPILGNNDFLRIHFSFTFQPCILVCSIIQKSVIYMGNFGNNLKVFVVMNDNEVNQKPNFVRVLFSFSHF